MVPVSTFIQKRTSEREEAKDEIFRAHATELQTSKKNGVYVFFSLEAHVLESFVNTIQTLKKEVSVLTLRFSQEGFHQTEQIDATKRYVIHLYPSFFSHYEDMETGLHVEVPVLIEEFLALLTFGRRKTAYDVEYCVISNAGVAMLYLTRHPRQTTPKFCARTDRKIVNDELFARNPFEDTRLRWSPDMTIFSIPSTTWTKAIAAFTKDNVKETKAPSTSTIFVRLLANRLFLGASELAVEGWKCTQMEVLSIPKEAVFQGIFPNSIIVAFCKIDPRLDITLGLLEKEKQLRFKTVYPELVFPGNERSHFEIHLFDASPL